MSDTKSERLLNLTMALLASKRFLSKGEILQSVAGYSGKAESIDRMFERDKDDLRSLGIEIETGSLDSLFNDEIGYRINPKNFVMQMPSLTSKEMAYVSLALQLWREKSLDESSRLALARLQTLGVETITETEWLPVDPSLLTPDFEALWKAISDRKILRFVYNDVARTVVLTDLYLGQGSWYLQGIELPEAKSKSFKFSRIQGTIEYLSETYDGESLTQDEAPNVEKQEIRFKVNPGSTFPDLKNTLVTSSSNGDVICYVEDEFTAIRLALHVASIAVLVYPDSLRMKIHALLMERTS